MIQDTATTSSPLRSPLSEVFQGLGLDADTICVDSLRLQADISLFDRFDRFNDRYNVRTHRAPRPR